MRKIFLSAFFKAFLTVVLFVLSYIFYNLEIVRGNIEDTAFDKVNKFVIQKKERDTNSSTVMLFAIDDMYQKANGLYDENNKTNYGYLFPRGKIADFIKSLDEFSQDIEKQNKPKALFIDYDFSFTTLPYGKELSKEDIKLLNTLKQKRDYTILIPKTNRYNFIENSNDLQIQKLIKEKKIIFVSVALLKSSDGASRRYLSYRKYRDREENSSTEYICDSIALWQLMQNRDINLSKAKNRFLKNDIVANRIFFKTYKAQSVEDSCITQKSYWKKYTKYSASCSFYDIDEDEFRNSIIFLGGTYTGNGDEFDTLNVMSSHKLSGVEIHVNALMTILYLDGQLKRLPLIKSATLLFMVLFIISFSTSYIFTKLKINNSKFEFILVLVVSIVILIVISIYLLLGYKLWFNWFVPLLLFELIEVIEFLKKLLPKVIEKIKTKKNNYQIKRKIT